MRKEIRILWLEDEINSPSHQYRKDIVSELLKEKGYGEIFCEYAKFSDAKIALGSSKRYDFFISDYNLDNTKTGLNYLQEIRETRGYKQFVILYSNQEYNKLRDKVIDSIKEHSFDIFSNFTFFSTGDGNEEEHFEKAINIALCRWDELNALRGEYMYENAELEYLLRKKINEHSEDVSYKTLINRFFGRQSTFFRWHSYDYEKIQAYRDKKQKWLALVDKRNALAHVTESYQENNGYFISSERITIHENDIDKERCDLLTLVEEIKEFLTKPYY